MIDKIYSRFFINNSECLHEKITPTSIGKFCPDCGKKIFISWTILRCKCCSTKRQSQLYMRSIIPVEKYCSKCGSKKYFIERKNELELCDINFALLIKEEGQNEPLSNKKTQVWIEESLGSYNPVNIQLISNIST